MVEIDKNKYINGISGEIKPSPDSPFLAFDILLRKDGVGVDVQLGLKDRTSMSVPVTIPVQLMVGIALNTLAIATEKAKKKADEKKGLAA